MSGKAAKIMLTEGQHAILQQIIHSTTAAQRLMRRARLIVLAFDGMFNGAISGVIGLRRKQIGLWRRRWKQSFNALVAIECRESKAALSRAIEDVLGDAPRSGSSGKFTAEQVTQVLAVACEPPNQSGRPIDEWTGRELADELAQRGIVRSISASQVNRYLAEAELQPHRSKYWLNTTEKDPQLFEQQVQIVCQCYQEAPELYFQYHTHTVSVDEMTGMQALERNAKTIPMKPGRPARPEFEYTRHGTLCLIGNWHVVLGQMIAPTVGPTRTEKDFCRHIQQTVATDPQAGWAFVVDNLNTHCSESLVRYVARLEGIEPGTLGQKDKAGILKSMPSRQAFLSDRKPSDSFRVLAEAQFLVEPDRNRVRDCDAACPATWQLQIDGSLAGPIAGLHRLLQPHVCQTIPLDLYRPSRDGRHRAAPGDLEGKMGKPPRIW